MKNPHIIVGENKRCLCGIYDGKPVTCGELLSSLADLVKHANISGSGVSMYAAPILRYNEVIQTLVEDRP
jgi:hypothetical protein